MGVGSLRGKLEGPKSRTQGHPQAAHGAFPRGSQETAPPPRWPGSRLIVARPWWPVGEVPIIS